MLLLKRLVVAYVLYALCRILFVALNPHFLHYPAADLAKAAWYGLVFDTSAIIYTNSLFIFLHVIPFPWRGNKFYQRLLFTLFIAVNSLAAFMNLVDIEYVKFSGKRSGMEIFGMRKELRGVTGDYLKDYWYLLLLLAAMVAFIVFLYRRAGQPRNEKPSYLREAVVFIVVAGACVIGARGGFQITPLNTFDAARLVRADLVPVVVNTPFNMILGIQKSGLAEKNYMSEAEAARFFNPEHFPDSAVAGGSRKNIVLIVVESLGKEYVGYYNHGAGYTPFIDSLASRGIVYTHAYANAKRSIEGIPCVVASMPSWMDNDYVSSYYQSNRLRGIGAYLGEEGYDASFYHGGRNGTMSFDNFTAVTEAGKYYGLNEYPDKNDFDGKWGIYDEPYLQYFARELAAKPRPFFSTVFTLSSHHPYKVPDGLKHMFPEGTLPIHKAVRYADYSLRRFFRTAAAMPWFDSTIFIITADHSGENEKPYYQTSQGKYEIPLIIYGRGIRHEEIPATAQQLDIEDLVTAMTGYHEKIFSFGNGGNKTRMRIAVQYPDHFYQAVSWPFVYQFDGNKPIGFYYLATDSLMKKNLVNTSSYLVERSGLDLLLKSIIQQYNARLIENRTYISPEER